MTKMDYSENSFSPSYQINIDETSLQVNLKEINESPESRAKCLEMLRGKLISLEDIEPCLEEAFLLRFLRVSKFDTSKAYQRILKYYKQHEKLLDSFKDLSIPLQKVLDFNYLFVSPYRLKDNSLLIIILGGKIDHSMYTYAEFFYFVIMAINREFDIPANQIAGATLLYDSKGFNFRSVREYTPGWMLLSAETCMNAYPARIKAVHVVNTPTIGWAIWKTISPLFPKKTRERLILHPKNSWTDLHAAIHPEILPEEYGGKQKLSSFINIMNNVEELEDGFHKMFSYGYHNTKARRQSFRPICWNNRTHSI